MVIFSLRIIVGFYTQNLLGVISKGKISLLSCNIASIGRNTANNLYVLEAIEGYASVLLNILRPALEVAPPKAVSEISLSLKEQWQWHLFEAVSYVTYQNRTRRSNAFLHKYEEQLNHSQKNRSTITIAANDSFLYRFWEEEKYIQLAMTRRREEEELKDKTGHSHGTWEEVYRNAKRALKSKRELPVRNEEELERTGQPLCIYEPYFGLLKIEDQKQMILMHVHLLVFHCLITLTIVMYLVNMAPSLHLQTGSTVYTRMLGWGFSLGEQQRGRTAKNALLDAIESSSFGDAIYFWVRMDMDPQNPLQKDFWSFCDAINAGNCNEGCIL